MKNITLSTIAVLLFALLVVSGCSPASPPEPPTVEAGPTLEAVFTTEPPTPTEPPAPTAVPTPTATPAPTEPPPPLPCNITFDSDRDGNWEIYRMDPDGSSLANLTNDPADDWNPVWSPDGSQIAFVSNRDNGQEGGQFIYVMNADGSDVRQLTVDNESRWPDWSHDGSRITYTHQGDIFTIQADGSGQAVNLTGSPEEDGQSSWSPDGSQMLWLSGRDGSRNLFIMNADGSDARQLTSGGNVFDAAWTVDGQILLHWENPEAGCFNCVMDAGGSTVVDAGGKGEIQRYLPFWTVDGRRVELAQVDLGTGNEEIYLVGEVFPDIFFNLTNNPAQDRNPDWPASCGPGEAVP